MQTTNEIYGGLPDALGVVNIDAKELMFWLYCPIKLKGRVEHILPDNLRVFDPIVRAARKDQGCEWADKYVYLTAKRLWCAPGAMGQRPGWHSDGFLTSDVNYIWYDEAPTLFFGGDVLYSFTADHAKSMIEMAELCEPATSRHHTFPAKTVLRLTESHLHRPSNDFEPCFRTFVKVSVSDHVYAHEGNATNPRMPTGWQYIPRGRERNCPITRAA